MKDAGEPDALVIGGGIAGLCAAIAGVDQGLKVTLLERAPHQGRGGNTAYAGGAMRFAFNSYDEIKDIAPDLSADEMARFQFGSYPQARFLQDMAETTEYRCNPDLASRLVQESQPTIRWLRSLGVRFSVAATRPNRMANGTTVFPTGLVLRVNGGGKELSDRLYASADDRGVTILYGARATSVRRDIRGYSVEYTTDVRGASATISVPRLIIATGGFAANAAMRAQYLGSSWDLAKPKGSPYSTGDGVAMGTALGAEFYGHLSGCHAVAWDRNAPDRVPLNMTGQFGRNSYSFGIMVNESGARFVDEGSDFRYLGYARMGKVILQQPHQVAWQLFDATVSHLLADNYHSRHSTRVQAGSIRELAGRMSGVDPESVVRTVEEFNASISPDLPALSPTTLDGRHTEGLPIEKTNWATPLILPPYTAYQVTAGITFTYGGLRVDNFARVQEDGTDGAESIDGLFACGDVIGGMFYFNYPGGSALTSAAVFGRLAGQSAARFDAVA